MVTDTQAVQRGLHARRFGRSRVLPIGLKRARFAKDPAIFHTLPTLSFASSEVKSHYQGVLMIRSNQIEAVGELRHLPARLGLRMEFRPWLDESSPFVNLLACYNLEGLPMLSSNIT